MKAELFQSSNCDLGEGPIWHDGLLWWVDIEAGRLLNSSGEVYTAPFSIGAALPCRSGRWLLAEEEGFSWWDVEGDPVRFWCRPDASPAYRFNDAKVAPDGSVWAGSLKRETLDGTCTYYRLDATGQVVAEISTIGLCNGLDWFGDRFYFTDTGAQSIFVRDGAGTEVFATMEAGYPDGLAVDATGNVWVALWGESKVVCLDGETSNVVATVEVPATQVTSCCFGGDDRGTLYITTARVGLSEQQLETHPQSGSVFCCRPGVEGQKARLFDDQAMT